MGTSQGQGASLPQPWAGCDLSVGSPLREPVFLKHNLGDKLGSPELEGQDMGLEGKGQQMRRNQRLLIKPLPDATRKAAQPRLRGPSPDTHRQAGKLRRRVARLGFPPRWSESRGCWQWRRGVTTPFTLTPCFPLSAFLVAILMRRRRSPPRPRLQRQPPCAAASRPLARSVGALRQPQLPDLPGDRPGHCATGRGAPGWQGRSWEIPGMGATGLLSKAGVSRLPTRSSWGCCNQMA